VALTAMILFRSLRARAWSAAVLIFLLIILLGLFSLWRLEDYHLSAEDIRDRYLQNTQFLGDLNNSTSDFRAAEAAALLASTPFEVTENTEEISRLDRLIMLAQHNFERVPNDDATGHLYVDFLTKWRHYRRLADQVLSLSGSNRQVEGVAIYRTSSRLAYDAASDALGLLTERNRHDAAESSRRAERAYRQARLLTVLAVVIAGLIVIGGLIHTRRAILRPLLDLARRMRRLARNDMDIGSEGIARNDEVGEMARAIEVFRNNAVDLAVSQQALAQHASMLSEKLAHEQHLAELQRNFVSMASHEFRTPLTIIDGQAQRLINMKDRLEPDGIAQRARGVRAAVARMTSVIDNLINASRLIDGQTELYFHPSTFDLAGTLHEICQTHRELTPRAAIVEHIRVRPMTILGDQKLLSQVFHNLVANAVKYSPAEAAVRVWCEHDGKSAVIAVEDRGLGIPAADREHIFERYYRGGNVAGIVGSGIGLYLVKTVVDLHHGEISVESGEGMGSRFTVRLPAEVSVQHALSVAVPAPF
jgi:two-component system, OmpR family, sensor kinase